MRRAALLVVIAVVFSVSTARADGDRVRILRDPIPYTNVADAADDDDPFDLNLTVGFGYSRYRADIQREFTNPSTTGGTDFAKVGRYEHVRQTLDVNLELGLFRDLSAYVYLPIVLSDSQSIGASPGGVNPAADVFTTPFNSPTRSGFDGITTGLAWAPLNQNRTPEAPTWVILVDTTTPIGRLIHACNAASAATLSQAPCNNAPGLVHGTQRLHLETRISRRYRFVEPYFGLGARGEIPTSQKEVIRPTGNLAGYQRKYPPIVAQFSFGAAFIPFEHLRRFQRLVIDLRVNTEYVSAGRDFTPLFDAFGSSPALSNSVVCEDGSPGPCTSAAQGVGSPFYGVTDIDAYGRIGGRVTIDFQANRWFRINFTSNVAYVTAHYLSTAAACNAGVSASATDPRRGTCDVGIVNPEYRSAIDEPGSRFHITGGMQLDFLATAVAQF